ncbi:WecB/TagA/CpsF family glycosyltransferase [Clostridium perfringens]|uniref:WecB/TagA/CpsF family glycosyltransferase n=1 Tax=Clostridium perfringens TaxID=1502 RepID=UPI000E1FB58A|nr:WecB/TagA/CpsF family glycosyltransferase [Clostridium perfringens]ELC8364551.1 WecB/TagA/CpsF family glycosyltransferase [Clostridium perfringens]ELC8365496.1 WecB/TagA/CpsF family glycosyltransferase [Clostridium perfringens]UBK74364.1 WecB/TagA/CpsF family glycosyltransferase [Clostridium perfringens]HAT4143119.1 WecB/TagA/CpsF family glycosyltransferase [Clostridium perfringens]HAT4146251.1 WecB/TagA/CpsF family glycosyltransferase [Clostridium perfringens]
MSRMNFLNIEVDNITMNEAIDRAEELIIKKKPSYVVTPNVDHIVKLENDKEFQEVYKYADLILTDGMPLIWISKIKGNPIKEKISGSDFFPKLCERAAKKGYSIFLLGAAEGVATKAAKNLKEKYEGLNIVGTYSPSYGFEKKDDEIKMIIEMVNKAKPDILAVGLGAPKQEKFLHKYRNDLNVPISLAIGASIDFEAGNINRAPKWMQNCGLEWFYRLCKEPKRMFKRYLVDDLKIIKIAKKY